MSTREQMIKELEAVARLAQGDATAQCGAEQPARVGRPRQDRRRAQG